MSLDLASGMGETAISALALGERRHVSTALVEEEIARAVIAAEVAPTPEVDSTARPTSRVCFADGPTKEKLCDEAAALRAIVLRPRADAPGSLASGIDGDLESALALRGALPSALAEGAPLEARLYDQLQRATCLPVRGICVALPPLGACVEADGVLADVDARYLGAWLRAVTARALPVSVVFDDQDRSRLARVPRSLADVVADLDAELAPPMTEPSPSSPAAEAASGTDATRPTDDIAPRAGVLVEASDDDEDTSYFGDDEGVSIPDLLGMSDDGERSVDTASLAGEPAGHEWTSSDSDVRDVDTCDADRPDTSPLHAASDEARCDEATASLEAVDEDERGWDEVASGGAPPVSSEIEEALAAESRIVESPAIEATSDEPSRAEERRPLKSLRKAMSETLRPPSPPKVHVATLEPAPEQVERLVHSAEWRSHAVELDAARGPKPVSAIERLFAQRYLPLLGALMRGEVDHAVSSIIEQWSQAFAESYTDAFSALRVTGKRPTMVLDAFDVASRIARLSSARSVKLVLVDSMSFDLAERVSLRMKTALDKRAVLVERTTLWSALPTTTPTQMQLLARGPEALRDTAPVSSSEPDITRGRNIATLRRERVGSRELMKLDLVEARLRGPGPAYDERLDAIADEVSDVLVKLMETLPPRTLLYVFGDHGFSLGLGANGWATGGASQGGASPEEVLVAGHAWLVDAMQ